MTTPEAAPPTRDYPYRLVDGDYQTWLHTGEGLYRDEADRDWTKTTPYDEVLTRPAPLRPVLPITDEDQAEIARLLETAELHAAASVLAGIYRATKAVYDREAPQLRPLHAGCPGSWETERLPWLAWEIGADLNDQPRRLDEEVTAGIAAMIQRWVTDPARYTEVAENLAAAFSRHTDKVGGWYKVSDGYMWPGHPVPGIGWKDDTREYVVTYLLSGSDHMDLVVWTPGAPWVEWLGSTVAEQRSEAAARRAAGVPTRSTGHDQGRMRLPPPGSEAARGPRPMAARVGSRWANSPFRRVVGGAR